MPFFFVCFKVLHHALNLINISLKEADGPQNRAPLGEEEPAT